MRVRRVSLLTATVVLTTGLGAPATSFAGTVRIGQQQSGQPDFRKGALYGRVVDAATGQPVAGAMVALKDKGGKTVAWTRTDPNGYYSLAAETVKVLQLQPSRRRGLLLRVARGVGGVVMAPVKVVGTAAKAAGEVVKQVDPLGTAKAAVVTTVTGNPAPVASQLAGSVKEAIETRAEQKAADAQKNLVGGKAEARAATARTVLGERQKAAPKEKREQLLPGEVFIAVSAPNYPEVRGKAGAYWLEPPRFDESGKQIAVGAKAWLETVKLAPAGGTAKGEIENVAILLSEPRVEQTLVPAGGKVRIWVKVSTPGNQPLNIRVFAREDRRDTMAELVAEGNGIYGGDLTLDPKTPAGETVVSVVALRAEPVEINVRKTDKGDPLQLFARELEELEPDKPFEYDPRIFAAENRLDINLTVLDPKLGTPTTPAATPTTQPATPPANPAPAAPAPAAPAPAAPAPAAPAAPAIPPEEKKPG